MKAEISNAHKVTSIEEATAILENIAAQGWVNNAWNTLPDGGRIHIAYNPVLGESLNDSKIEFRSRPTYDSSKFYFTDI